MKTLALSALIGLAALAIGCGGGGGGATVTREQLTGGSSKLWNVSLVRANASYTNGDNNQDQYVSCPYRYSPRSGSGPAWSCATGDHMTFSEDGTVEYAVGEAGTGGDGTWSLSGSTLTIDFGTRGKTIDTVEVRNSGRIVLRRVRREVGGAVQTTEAQNAYVIVNP
jgi:hypothetical protein